MLACATLACRALVKPGLPASDARELLKAIASVARKEK